MHGGPEPIRTRVEALVYNKRRVSKSRDHSRQIRRVLPESGKGREAVVPGDGEDWLLGEGHGETVLNICTLGLAPKQHQQVFLLPDQSLPATNEIVS